MSVFFLLIYVLNSNKYIKVKKDLYWLDDALYTLMIRVKKKLFTNTVIYYRGIILYLQTFKVFE